MRVFEITSSTKRTTAFDAAAAVAGQKNIIAAMRFGDPGLPFAKLMLSLMEQNAAAAELNLAFISL